MTRRLVAGGLALLVLAAAGLWAGSAARWSFSGLWLTPDQRGQWLEERGRHAEAAKAFADPLRQAEALYRARQYKEAAAAFGRVDRPQAAYGRGNALVMSGDYPGAIASYRQALAARPDWVEAQENLEIARIRQERLDQAGADAAEESTGGQLAADSIVFDDRAQDAPPDQVEQTEGGAALADDTLRAMWLQRVQTRPADFLRVKFAFQDAVPPAQDAAPPGGAP
ncbi:tetratricopeptide repeat protein [Geminicoccus roseus]|uniref:tetratricopeptide repeat protein n=1 Tax=Geminicoccus roseus TaxID=404900 RepID=UPI00054D21B8|nr:tetratricopeptide repeat protein [Geminicoccus roseus]